MPNATSVTRTWSNSSSSNGRESVKLYAFHQHKARSQGGSETYMLPYTHSIRLAISGSSMLSGICTSTRSKPTWKSRMMKPAGAFSVSEIHTNVDVFQYLAEFTIQRPNCASMSTASEPSVTYGRNQAMADRADAADDNRGLVPTTFPC